MNKVMLMGRLVRDPEIRYSQGAAPVAIAKYSLAVNRRFKKQGEGCAPKINGGGAADSAQQSTDREADFINCIAFGKSGEFAEKYLKKGTQICVVGRIQTGSYTNKEGQKVYTTDVVAEEHYFCGSKEQSKTGNEANEGFYPIDESVDNSELPF